MRALLVFVLLGAAALAQGPVPAARPVDAAKRAAIEELLSLMKSDQLQEQMISQVQLMVAAQIEKSLPSDVQGSPDGAKVRDFENRLFDLMKDEIDFAKLKPEFIRLYDETFSSEEVAGIGGFLQDPGWPEFSGKDAHPDIEDP